jgi:hypothetical protein
VTLEHTGDSRAFVQAWWSSDSTDVGELAAALRTVPDEHVPTVWNVLRNRVVEAQVSGRSNDPLSYVAVPTAWGTMEIDPQQAGLLARTLALNAVWQRYTPTL